MKKLWDKAFVINLDKRKDRYDQISNHLKDFAIDFERVSAVSPETIPDSPPEKLRDFLISKDGDNVNIDHKLYGTWACMHSHLKVMKISLERGYENILILEDDCRLEDYALKVITKVEEQINSKNINFDMLYLGGRLVGGHSKKAISKNISSIVRIKSTYSYIVNSRLFNKIIDEAPKSSLPIDWYYSENLQKNINSLLIDPIIASHCYDGLSDIENIFQAEKKVKLAKKFKKIINKLKYK